MTNAADPVQGTHRRLQRFTPVERFSRWLVLLLVVSAIVVSTRHVQIIPEFLYDAPEQMLDLLQRLWPPDLSYYQIGVHEALVETLHIASLGTILALILALPVALFSARNITSNPVLQVLAKFILVSSRSVNSLVWALLFVAIFGPGTLAGVLAIAFRSVGFVGKLLGEALEEANMGTIEALSATGAPRLSILLKGYWPQVKPALWSIALFRWDINVRESAVLGLVGAGGIGVALNNALNTFYWDKVSTVLLSIFAVVIIAELVVTEIRKRII
ncbi:phosphonate ABC transporter, permease protein PhnE [Oceanibacterium hippocampi]|uniref:Phosphate-import permease protein PhnE n=1 Tax=Oceanibacterium hippocampi TaxID=745714 RepID=A0A1Y5TJP4_9PROT|nr:phosphonate ABC transporter, permease protein PhnE [Oceanibacterium hippocampi]SLN65560.1 Phosphate-import permease protein PhnE [Oceanibacterium hippocampi]